MTTLSCQEIRERIMDGEQDAELLSHAKTCAECAPILAALDDVDADLAALTPIDAPDALVETTLARVREEAARVAAPVTVGSPSLLMAAFAMLASAVGAFLTAPIVAVRWLLGVGSVAASGEPSIEDRGKAPRRSFGLAPMFAIGSALIVVIAFATFETFGTRVRSKTRGASDRVNGLPMYSPDGEIEGETANGWWEGADDSNATTTATVATEETAPDPSTNGRFEWHGDITGAIDGVARDQYRADDDGVVDFEDESENRRSLDLQLRGYGGGEGAADTAAAAAPSTAAPSTGTLEPGSAEQDGRALIVTDLPVHHSAEVSDETLLAEGANDERAQAGEQRGPNGEETTTRTHAGIVTRAPGGSERRLGALEEDSEGDGFRSTQQGIVTLTPQPSYWDLAQRTSGLTFASSQSWWSNSYVPGDARLRVLHARLAASPLALAGGPLSALALAELATPTVPAVAAPTDRALAIGVHADTTAIEGPTRVRMEIALRAIDQAAGRRGALRIALVVDARGGLGTDEAAHLRSLLASLSHSLSARDRVILTAAGPGGGTLVPLGVLRHGQVEVALRHLAETGTIAGEAISTSLEDALAAGLEAVAVDDDGAGLTLLVTPNASHDAGVDQALHLGAIAGVPTTAVGIGTSASTSSLDAIALAGEGRRRVILSDDDATRAVREELSAASRLVARALRVRVRLADGVQLVDVVGSHSLDVEETRRTRESERAIDQSLARRLGIGQDRDDDESGIRILVPSFYAGDSHTIVLDLLVTRPGPVADVDVRFKDLVRLGNGTASSALALEAGTAPRGPHELRVVASFIGHEVAGALDGAAEALDRGDVVGARARLVTAQALLDQARSSVDGLSSVRSIASDRLLLDRFLVAIDTASDHGIVAASLHYAAARRLVIPQLQSSTP